MLAMVVPTILISAILGGVVSSLQNSEALSLSYSFGASFSVWLISVLVGIIGVVLFESAAMGYLTGDETETFKFEDAFVAFKQGNTWLVASLYAAFMDLISFIFGALFVAAVGVISASFVPQAFGFNTTTAQIIALIIVGIVILALVGIAWIFVATGLAFIYLTYFDAKRKGQELHLMAGFSKSWNLMNGKRWDLIGLKLLTLIIAVVTLAIIAVVGALLWWIFASMLTWTVFAIVLEAVLAVLAVAISIFYTVWFTMANIKFYEEIK
ncbi:hypothetical protein [Fructilactobacillus fructivorans]|uniref:hypothetical protein n=1 Tax=Fructilactobacillus fructivorans TaxID=1614 RepID=UPI0012E82D6C|nr:hypothetical protein [Fructilactobacillus fructivorans]